MGTVSPAEFMEQLHQLGLLNADQEREALALADSFPEARSLAGELTRRGWLTPFQVNRLLQQRGPDLILGPYVLLERLGEGGMGAVFKARHRFMNRLVALKLISPELLGTTDAINRFLWEMQVAGQLQHPNIVQAHDGGQAGARYFLVMELVEGKDLARLVKEQGPLPVGQACDCVRQAALALQHAHEKGLVHRDVKPSNLMLAGELVKLLDLGLARLVLQQRARHATQTGSMLGTADYLAPEQALDPRRVDIRADIYGLGCTLYFLLAGHPPFDEGTAAQKLLWHQHADPPPIEGLRADVPRGVGVILRRMMAKRREDRYQTPAEAAVALRPFCAAAYAARTVETARTVSESAPQPEEDLPAIPERGWTLRVPGSSGPPAPGRERIQIPPLPGNGDPNPAPQEPPVLPLAPEVKPRGGVLRALVKALGLVLLLVTAALLGNLFLPQEGPHRQLVVALYPPLEGDGKSGPEGKGPGGAPLKLPVDPPPPAGPNFKQKWEEAEEKLKKSNAERAAALARGDKAEAARVQAEEREAKAEAGRLKAVGEALTARKEADAAASEATKERARADRAEQDAATARTRVEALEKTTAKAEKVHLEAKAVVRLVNSTGRELSYELSWQKWDGTETPWQEFKVNASGGRVHTQRGAIWVWVRFEQTAGNKVIRSMRFEQYLEKEEVVERQVRIVYHFEQEGKQLALRWGQAK